MDDEIRAAFIAEQNRLLAAAQRERGEDFHTGCRELVRCDEIEQLARDLLHEFHDRACPVTDEWWARYPGW